MVFDEEKSVAFAHYRFEVDDNERREFFKKYYINASSFHDFIRCDLLLKYKYIMCIYIHAY